MSDFIAYLKDAIYFSLIFEERYQLVLSGLVITLVLTIASFALGTLLGMVLCAGMGSQHAVLRGVSRASTAIVVKLPPLVLLMLFAYLILAGSGLGAVSIAIVCFTCKCGAHLAEIFRSAVDSVAPGEIEAARTLGFSKWQAFFQVVFPQAVAQAMSLYKTQFILTMQDTSVVSLLAIPDLTRSVTIITSRTLDPVITLVITTTIYLLLGFLANLLLGRAEQQKHILAQEMEETCK